MLSILQPATLRKRLWQGGVAMAVLVMTIAGINRFSPQEKSVTPQMLGHDFLPFYTAGLLVRNGCADLLYDLDTIDAAEHEIGEKNGLEMGKSFGPFWNPPFYAWVFVPFAGVSYREALLCWTLLNVAALLCALLLLRRMFAAGTDWKTVALVPLLILVSMPFIQAISHGQNTFTSLLLVTMIATAWRLRRPISAGIACGLLMYKPQLAVVLAVVLSLDLGWRAALAVLGTGATLLLITGFTLPGTIPDYISKLPVNLHFMQVESAYLWERHVTFRAFWRLLLQGRAAGEMSAIVKMLATACALVVGCGLLVAVRNVRRPMIDNPWTGQTQQRRRDRLIAATIACTPLIMPFYFDYDLLLLTVPATLLAAELSQRPIGQALARLDRLLIGAWSVMFLWMTINPGMGVLSGVNGTTLLLTIVAGLLLRRAARSTISIESSMQDGAAAIAARRIAA